MAGTHEGGQKAAETAKERHGEDFHEKIGSKGGQHTQGGSSKDDNQGSAHRSSASKSDNQGSSSRSSGSRSDNQGSSTSRSRSTTEDED